jgi:hypothetical protein
VAPAKLPASFVRAVQEGRYRDAATDPELQSRSASSNDVVARALLVLAAAHYLAAEGKVDGARLTIGRAVQFLEQAPLDPYAALLIEHSREALEALHGRTPVPPLPVDFR